MRPSLRFIAAVTCGLAAISAHSQEQCFDKTDQKTHGECAAALLKPLDARINQLVSELRSKFEDEAAIELSRSRLGVHLQRFARLVAGLTVGGAMLMGCGQLAPGMGEGWHTPVSEGLTYLRAELMLHFFDVLRPARQELAWLGRTNPNGGPYRNNRGVVPFEIGGAEVKQIELCTVRGDTNCGGVAFGDEILARPDVRIAVEDWLVHFCDRSPKSVSSEQIPEGYGLAYRASNVAYLRKFMGCDGNPKKLLNLHIYAVRDFDKVFNGSEQNVSETLRRSIVGDWVVHLNQ